jgi:hypothetical protein
VSFAESVSPRSVLKTLLREVISRIEQLLQRMRRPPIASGCAEC